MSQCSQIYVHMQDRGPITPLEAFRLYGILACHSRISELRARGVPIKCDLIQVGRKTVGSYSLDRGAR